MAKNKPFVWHDHLQNTMEKSNVTLKWIVALLLHCFGSSLV